MDYLDKELISLEILENRIGLSNDETKTKYLTKIYDSFVNGCFHGQIENIFSISIQYEKNDKKNTIEQCEHISVADQKKNDIRPARKMILKYNSNWSFQLLRSEKKMILKLSNVNIKCCGSIH